MERSLNEIKNDYNKRLIPCNKVKDNKGVEHEFNYKIGEVYFCKDNVIIDNGQVILDYHLDKNRYIVMDYFILDLKEKRIYTYEARNSLTYKMEKDSFLDTLKDIEKITIRNNKDGSRVMQFKCPKGVVEIKLDKCNRIVKYKNTTIDKIGDNFMYLNNALEDIQIPCATEIGDYFLGSNNSLKKIELDSIEKIGNSFMYNNEILESFKGYNATEIGDYFLFWNKKIVEFNAHKAKRIGERCLTHNEHLIYIDISSARTLGEYSFYSCCFIRTLYTSSKLNVGEGCFENFSARSKEDKPKVKKLGGTV